MVGNVRKRFGGRVCTQLCRASLQVARRMHMAIVGGDYGMKDVPEGRPNQPGCHANLRPMDSVTEPGILKDGIPVPVASGRESARFRETSLPVGICPGTGQKQTVRGA